MPRDLGDLVVSLSKMPGALHEAQGRAVRAAALHTTQAIRTEIRSATGDMRLSGVGKRGAKVGARFDVKGTANPTALIKATGPLHLVERDTRAHLILPGGYKFTGTGRRRRGGAKALKIGGGFAPYAEHPGTRGKRPWAKGKARAEPEAPRIFQREIRKAIGRTFG